MTEDEVLSEVRAARESFAAAHGYDIHAMVAALRELGVASDREVVRFASRLAVVVEPNRAPRRSTSAWPLVPTPGR